MSFPRWMLALPVVALGAAVPIVMAARDPLESERDRLAAMTPTQRKAIERSRNAYDNLSSLEKYELEQLSAAISKLDPKDREELDASMNRLAALVETFPDNVREKYFGGLASTRQTILKQQLAARKNQAAMIAGRVNEADRKHQQAVAELPARPFKERKFFDKVENNLRRLVQQKGTGDDKALFDLLRSNEATPKERMLLTWILANRFEADGVRKNIPFEPAIVDQVVHWARSLKIIPALDSLPGWGRLDEDDRKYAAKVLGQIYLLTPNPDVTIDEMYQTLKLPKPSGPPDCPRYLLLNLTTLKYYSCGKLTPPKKDVAAVRDLLGKSK